MWVLFLLFFTVSTSCAFISSFTPPFQRPFSSDGIKSWKRWWSSNNLLLWQYRHRGTCCSKLSKGSSFFSSTSSDVYSGPILPSNLEIIAGATLSELGLDLAIAPSVTVPTQLGLYVRLVEGVDSVTLPSMTLLCGYAKQGTFQSDAVIDCGKTVGFLFNSAETAVFLDRQLMSISDALQYAAKRYTSCGLLGHDLQLRINNCEDDIHKEEDGVMMNITPIKQEFLDEEQSRRYFVPDMVRRVLNNEEINVEEFVIQNFGQYSNDLAWDVNNPPRSQEEYIMRSDVYNILQLVWRLEYSNLKRCLVPSWPVTIFSRDITFENDSQFMEVGTSYGWNYWHALMAIKP